MPDSGRPCLLWIAVNQFDKAVDKATWLETTANMGEDFNVHFLTGWGISPIQIMINGSPIMYFPQYGHGLIQKVSRHLMMSGEARRQIVRLSPNIVLLNCLNKLGMVHSVLKAARKYGCRAVLDVRTLPTSEHADPAWVVFAESLRFASRHYDGITYISEAIRRYCIDRFELPEHPSTIWASGVNADAFQLAAAASADLQFRLLYHGGIISVSRGLDRLIKAIDQVRDLNVHLTLISSLREPAAIEWIDRLDLHDRVRLVDTIPYEEVPAHIQQCHAGVLPFPNRDVWNTSSPIKLFEYLSCGKPVIVTDIPAHRNVLDQKPFAFFSPDASPEALAGAIRQAYAARGSFTDLGRLARRQVMERHTWARQAETLGAFLKTILATDKQ